MIACREAFSDPGIVAQMIRRCRSADRIEVIVDAKDGKSLCFKKRNEDIGMPGIRVGKRLGFHDKLTRANVQYGSDEKM